jgi:hypothetical protein
VTSGKKKTLVYRILKELTLIYTIPYMFDPYELVPDNKRYSNESINNVRNLTVLPKLTTEKCLYWFS